MFLCNSLIVGFFVRSLSFYFKEIDPIYHGKLVWLS